jgi:hypothetical protein
MVDEIDYILFLVPMPQNLFFLMKKFAIPMLVGAKNATCCIGF